MSTGHTHECEHCGTRYDCPGTLAASGCSMTTGYCPSCEILLAYDLEDDDDF